MKGSGKGGAGIGARTLKAALWLLPAWLRRRVGREILDTYLERRTAAARSGSTALFRLWIRELGGIVATAVRARFGSAWARRTRSPEAALPGRSREAEPADPPGGGARSALRNLSFGLRLVRRRPLRTIPVILTLAVGIGAGTGMFSVVDSVLLKPAPYPEPERLYWVYPTIPRWRDHPTLAEEWDRGWFSYPEYQEWRERQGSFSSTGALSVAGAVLKGPEGALSISILRASADLFGTLGVRPVAGRLFTPDDYGEDSERIIMLSEGFWRSRYGADPGVVGDQITLSYRRYTVVGVVPDVFGVLGYDPQGWIPASDENWENHSYKVVARLASGVTPEVAESESSVILPAIAPPDHGVENHGANLVSIQDERARPVRTQMTLLVAASLLLVLVACGNAAVMLLGSGAERTREMAVRSALGAGRGGLAGQLLGESLVLASFGAAGGVALAAAAVRLLVRLAPGDMPALESAALDIRVLAFSVGLSLLTGVLAGMAPTLSVLRRDLARAFHAGGTRASSGKSTLQSAIVAGQIALATVLLVGGGLLTRTLLALNEVDRGFDPAGVLAVNVSPDWGSFDGEDRIRNMDAYFARLVAELETIPGVSDAAITSVLPFGSSRANNRILPQGRQPDGGEVLAARRKITAGYLEVIGARLLEGRTFTEADQNSGAEPVMIVSRSLAAEAWPGESAVGKTVDFWAGDGFRVVGVVEDQRDADLAEATDFAFYVPPQWLGSATGYIVLKTDPRAGSLAQVVRTRIAAVDPELAVTQVAPLDELIQDSLSERRYRARLIIAFAVLAALLALSGVYGVTSRWVARRTREMGIRLALGAGSRDLTRLVLQRGAAMAAVGGVAGLLISAWGSSFIESFLFGVEAGDPLTLALVAAAVAGLSLLAALGPSRRATRVDPVEALRAE